MRPTSAAQMPAAFTTTSHAIGPLSTTTPLTRPPPTVIATMRAPVSTLAPRARAPSVRAVARPAGSTWPSLGSQSAPSSDASVMSGNRSRASRALMSPTSSPNRRAQRSRSWSSLSRAGPDPTRRLPTPLQPESRPLLPPDPPARGGGAVPPPRRAVARHLEAHEGAEEHYAPDHAVASVPSVRRRALTGDGELPGPERQEDPLAVPTDVRSDPQPLALPVHEALPGRDHPARQEIRDADEVGDEVGAGPRVDLLWAPDLLDPAVPHHRDAVGDRERLLLIVGDVEGRDPEVLLDPADLAAKTEPDLRVERRERLVEQEDLRAAGERAGERDPLLLAARELVRVAALETTEARQRDHLGDALVDPDGRPSGHPQAEGDVLGDRHGREERVRLEDDADGAPARRHVVDDAIVEADLARVGPLEAGDQAERRRLAATRAADEGDELPPADLQGEPVHGGRCAEALGQAGEADAHVSERTFPTSA